MGKKFNKEPKRNTTKENEIGFCKELRVYVENHSKKYIFQLLLYLVLAYRNEEKSKANDKDDK